MLLRQKLFQPEAEQAKDFYAEKPIKIRLSGSYHEFGEFVSNIAALPRIVTLHDIEIAPVGKGGEPGSLVLNVTAKTYRYLDEEDQGEDTGAKPGKAKKAGKSGAGR